MKTVGLRQLKNNLSAYVRAAKAGTTIRVTDRGQVVVRLVPEPAASQSADPIERGLDELEQRGLLRRRATVKSGKGLYPKMPRLLPPGLLAKMLDEDRGDR
ncbi:MAG: type II toxin-antitoxin system prevent-host-death family antitoxin [Alphaproteobacteria bacterium]|nr:type II toxin-antitoxin system prevent-host-death family antitoxin [Alphaproteobacteria bacterium]